MVRFAAWNLETSERVKSAFVQVEKAEAAVRFKERKSINKSAGQ